MASRVAGVVALLALFGAISLLAPSTSTLAAQGSGEPEAEPPQVQKKRALLVVPEVRRQVYVFAKGILAEAGFAWRVEGPVKGHAGNFVATQTPGPGVAVVDTGLPTVVLSLERNPEYEERGLPENASPYEGTKLLRPGAPERSKRARAVAPKRKAVKATKAAKKRVAKPRAEPKRRERAFYVPGAPSEPPNAMPLPERARLLARTVARADEPSEALIEHWLYQHAWVVTGARFGWSDGADALRILLTVDRNLQRRWGIGARSAAVARAALAEVERKSR